MGNRICLAVLLGVLWVPIQNASQAQTPQPSKAKSQPAGPALGLVHPPAGAVALDAQVSLSGQQRTLVGSLDELAGQVAGCDIVINEQALRSEGIDLRRIVSLELSDVSLRTGLQTLLEPDLTFYALGGAIMVTSHDDAQRHPVTRMYRCGPFGDSIIQIVETTIQPDTWSLLGGPSTLQMVGDVLVASTLEDVHHRIHQLILQIAAAKSVDYKTWSPLRCSPTKPIAMALRRSVSLENPASLDALAKQVGQELNLQVYVNSRALEDVGLTASVAVHTASDQRSCAEHLQVALQPLGLAYMIRSGMLEIATAEAAQFHMSTVVYPVGDMTERLPGKSHWAFPTERFIDQSQLRFQDGIHVMDGLEIDLPQYTIDRLVETLQMSVVPNMWERAGGPCSVAASGETKSLVVSATERVHAGIQQAIVDLRATYEPAPAIDEQQLAESILTVGFRDVTGRLEIDQIADVIRTNVAADSWLTGNNSLGIVYGQRGSILVARNNLDTIQQVAKHLMRIGFLKDPRSPADVDATGD